MIPNLNHVYVLLEKLNDYARYSGLAEMVGLRGRFIVEEFVRYYQNPSSPKAGDMQKSIEELRSGRGRLNMPDWLFDELDQLRRNGNQASHGDKGITYTLPEAYTCAFSVVAWAVQRCFSKCLEIAKEISRRSQARFYELVVTSRAFSPGDMAGGASKVTVMNGSGEMFPGLSSSASASASGPDSKPRATALMHVSSTQKSSAKPQTKSRFLVRTASCSDSSPRSFSSGWVASASGGASMSTSSPESIAARIADCFMQTAPVHGALTHPIKAVALGDVSLAPAPPLVIRPSPATGSVVAGRCPCGGL